MMIMVAPSNMGWRCIDRLHVTITDELPFSIQFFHVV
jgi:hypothetical protein